MPSFRPIWLIRGIGRSSAEQQLRLLCETGQKHLNSYFTSAEQSVEMVASFVGEDLESLEEAELAEHVGRTRTIFAKTASKTQGILTYYYRIDPAVSRETKGFWYTNLDGNGFAEHEVTDISLYDTSDTSALVWFTVPKATGKAVWLPPYVTDNLDVTVLSYNMPVYCGDTFVGVIGIELDYMAIADHVEHIRLYDDGYAFINDDTGYIVYHPEMTDEELELERNRQSPTGMLAENAGTSVIFEIPDETEKAGYSTATKARLDSTKLQKLGWKAQFDLRTALAHTVGVLRELNRDKE